MSTRVTLKHGSLLVHFDVDLDGSEARARIDRVETKRGERVIEPLESDDVTELAHRAIEEAERKRVPNPTPAPGDGA